MDVFVVGKEFSGGERLGEYFIKAWGLQEVPTPKGVVIAYYVQWKKDGPVRTMVRGYRERELSPVFDDGRSYRAIGVNSVTAEDEKMVESRLLAAGFSKDIPIDFESSGKVLSATS